MSSGPSPQRRLIDLAMGEPGYDPPEVVSAVAARAIAAGVHGYAPPGGLPQLRRALAGLVSERTGVDTTPEEVVVTSGASQGLFATFASLCASGDEVLVPDPGFPLYLRALRMLGLTVTRYPLLACKGHEPDWAFLEAAAPTARMLLWNYPSNPLGAVASSSWLDRLYSLLDRFPRLVVVSDEVYEDVCLRGDSTAPLALAGALANRIVSVHSFSKSYSLASWRVGYVRAHAPWAREIAGAHWGMAMSTSTVGQLCALAALGAPAEYATARAAFLTGNLAAASDRLRRAGLEFEEPAAGFFLWASIASTGLTAADFARRCAREAGVLVSPGTDFSASADSRVRISFAAPADQLARALDALTPWLAAAGRPSTR